MNSLFQSVWSSQGGIFPHVRHQRMLMLVLNIITHEALLKDHFPILCFVLLQAPVETEKKDFPKV